jgi:hypothetical protein
MFPTSGGKRTEAPDVTPGLGQPLQEPSYDPLFSDFFKFVYIYRWPDKALATPAGSFFGIEEK